MFDNPNKELKRLQDQLLAAEEDGSAFAQEEPEETVVTDAEALEDMQHLLGRETSAEELGRTQVFHLVEEEQPADPKPADRKRRIGGLVVALLLEFSALMAVLAWWLRWR